MTKARDIDASRAVQFSLGLLLIAATVAAYQLVWRAGYIWDDDLYVTANPLLTAPDGLRRIWFSLDSPSQYFPLVYSVFRLEHALWGFDPSGYHWVNIALHATNAVLLLLLRIPGAWLAAALFALHPVQVESVAWVTELKNVLMGLFFLLTLYSWVRFIQAEKRAQILPYVAALVFYALALFSKTTACTLPAALVLILWLRRVPITAARWAQVAPFVVLGGAMGAVTVWWERFHQGTQGQGFAVGIPDRVLIASRAIWFYLGKLVWPQELCFSYPRWPISAGDPSDYLWVGITIAAAFAVWFLRRYFGRSVETAMVFFVATLSPMLGFIMLYTFRYSWVADHYQYLACIGPLALFAAGVDRASARYGRAVNVIVAVGGAALLLALGARTWQQGAIYRNAETLWRATIAVNPRSALAHNSLGVLLAGTVPIEEEEAEFRKAVEIDPNDAEAHNNIGHVLVRRGLNEEAIAEYERAVELHPRFAKAHGNLAMLLLQLGRSDDALSHLQQVLTVEPQNAGLEKSVGDILVSEYKTAEATEHWKRAGELAPDNAALQGEVGRAFAGIGKLDVALPYLRRAAELAPQDAQAHYNYATALSMGERFAEAIPEYREALKIQPDFAAARVNLATSYALIDRLEDAVAEFERSLESSPNDARVHKTLANLLRELGRKDESTLHEQRATALEAAAESR
ncbi:MAG: tetratricopeptide repeat protein [Verrucomicrobiota bacterium]|nr:tetratricopeptide repeat protein [Verrucomicrobiota bacterium]